MKREMCTNVSPYEDYPHNTKRNMYVLCIVSTFRNEEFSGLVPETLRVSSQDMLERFD